MNKDEVVSLLKKYINHIAIEEGITFISRITTSAQDAHYDDSVIFTEKEADFLRELEKQIMKENK